MISWYRESTFISGVFWASVMVRPSLTKVVLGVVQRLDQRINFLRRCVEVERGTRRGLHTESQVCRLGAVVASPYGHAARIQQLGDVVRMHAVEGEADCSAPVDRVLGADDRQAIDLLQRTECVAGDVLLMRGNVVHTNAGQVVGGGSQT